MSEVHTCEAAKDRKWPGLTAALFGPPRPRCGKPAALCRGGQWLCQECHDDIEQKAKEGKNLLGLLRNYQDKVDAGADPIEALSGGCCGLGGCRYPDDCKMKRARQ